MRELSARIKSLLRRPAGLLPTGLKLRDMELELETRTVKVGGQSVHLMPKQSALLEFLMRHPNRPFGAKALLEAVWPSESDASEDTVRTCVKTSDKAGVSREEDIVKRYRLLFDRGAWSAQSDRSPSSVTAWQHHKSI